MNTNPTATSNTTPVPLPLSTQLARRGIRTDEDFAEVFTALIGDTLDGSIDRHLANVACKAGANVLRVADMRLRHGRKIQIVGERVTAAPVVDARKLALLKLTDEERELLGVA